MRLFILAAGVGSRLMPLTKDTPKSLLDLGDGSNLLERQIKNAVNSPEIDEVVVIAGYKVDQMESAVHKWKEKINISVVFNPFYEISNNLHSLWSASHLMLDKDFIITNGDNIYKNEVYSTALKSIADIDDAIRITINYKDKYDSDDMKVTFSDNFHITRVHKDIPVSVTQAESIGLALIKGKESRNLFRSQILKLVRDKDYLNKFWLEVFNGLISDGEAISTVFIDKDNWREMDFHPDIEEIKREMLNKLI